MVYRGAEYAVKIKSSSQRRKNDQKSPCTIEVKKCFVFIDFVQTNEGRKETITI
jgi:hypothetical protein